MKLLDAIKNVTIKEKDVLLNIYYALEERKDVLESQEPFGSSDFFYEKWEEKYDEFCAIFEDLEFILEELGYLEDDCDEVMTQIDSKDVMHLEEKLNAVKMNLQFYQIDFGGLKRLKV